MAFTIPFRRLAETLFLLANLSPLSNALSCLPLSQIYPAPRNVSESPLLTQVATSLQATLDAIVTSNTTGTVIPVDTLTTSFSVDVFSLHSPGSIFNYHFTAPAFANATDGVSTVDDDSLYRIGSISKLLTVYTYLLAAGDRSWNDPVTQYIPELATIAAQYSGDDAVDVVDWASITVGDLASQLAGIGRDNGGSAERDLLFQTAGLPAVPAIDIDWCGLPQQLEFPCGREAFFEWFPQRHPVTVPGSSPVYSNVAFQILAYVLENITETSFPDSFQSELVDALNLNSTFYHTPPSPDSSVIPFNISASFWNYTLGDEAPAGNYFVSTGDMQRIGRSILNNTFLSKAQTKRWLKPQSFVSSTAEARQAVGSPFEIYEFPFLPPVNSSNSGPPTRTPVWIYAKSGDVGVYSTIFALIPDYDAAFTVFAAGLDPSGTKTIISDLVTNVFLPAFEAAAKEEAARNFAGTYADEANNSSLIVTPAQSGEGLVVEDWIANGTSVLAMFHSLLVPPALQNQVNLVFYLFPSGLTNANGTRTSWRMIFETFITETREFRVPDGVDIDDPALIGPNIFDGACFAWASVDGIVYGGNALDDMVFEVDARGRAVGVTTRGVQESLEFLRGQQKRDTNAVLRRAPVGGGSVARRIRLQKTH